MKKYALMLGPVLLFSCTKGTSNKIPDPTKDAYTCTECIVQGYMYSAKTKEPLVNKAIALSLKENNSLSASDTYVITDDAGFFKFTYNATDAKGSIRIYPRPKSYNSSISCIMGDLPVYKNLLLGKTYTSVEFP